MAIRPPSTTTQLEDLPPEEDGPSPDELVDFGGETTETFIARTGSPEPRPLAAGDAVPIFRTDLAIEKGSSAGLFEVGEPGTGRHFTLYEFELSIARMFDGRRHASDVIENGVRLGIPVELDGLNKFVRQLWRYGFLAPTGSAPGLPREESAWGEREKWDEATRTLFQTGLRLMRQGRPQDAQSYFQAVLDADPANAEATELLAAIERGESLVARPIGRRPAGHRAAPHRGRRWAIALAAAALVAAGAGAAAWLVRGRPPPPPPPSIALPAPRPPPPAWRTATIVARVHPRLAQLDAQGKGTVLWRASPGAHVNAGDRIGALRRAGRRDQALVAPAEGTLELVVADRARVAGGAPLAVVTDDRVWEIDAFVDGAPPAADAACELRGDSTAERIACRLAGAEPRDGGSGLRLTVTDADAPWAGSARSLRVRIAPPGTAPAAEAR